MIRWLKAWLWPCRHGIKIMAGGILMDKGLEARMLHFSDGTQYAVKCKRCQTVLLTLDGTIGDRPQEFEGIGVERILDEVPMLTKVDRDLWN